MSLFQNPFPQFLDGNGDPYAGAKVFLFETGTSTLKTIYADSDFTTPQSNPVIADANGVVTDDVYLDGIYRVVVQTASGVNIDGYDRDPIGDIDAGPYGDWSNDATYVINDIVQGSDAEYYISLTNANQGNDPTGDVVNWAVLTLLHDIDQTISGNKTFADPINLNMAQPRLRFIETDASADNGAWLIDVESEGMFFQLFEDDFITTSNFMEIQRTGVVCDSIDFTTTALTFNTNTIWSAGNDGPGSGLDADTVDGVEASAIIQTTGDQTMTGNLTVENSGPTFLLKEDDAAADNGLWRIQASVEAFTIKTRTDADGVGDTVLSISRTGTATDAVNFNSGELQAGGNEVYHFGNLVTKVKTADETVNNSATLQDDDHFTGFTLEADTYYTIKMSLLVNSNTTAELRTRFEFTNAVQSGFFNVLFNSDTGPIYNNGDFTSTFVGFSGLQNGNEMVFNGSFRTNASTGGTMKFQWAQSVATVFDTKILAHSTMEVRKIP